MVVLHYCLKGHDDTRAGLRNSKGYGYVGQLELICAPTCVAGPLADKKGLTSIRADKLVALMTGYCGIVSIVPYPMNIEHSPRANLVLLNWIAY